MNILAIDTSSYVMGTALLRDGSPLAEIATHEKKNHSLRLAPALRQLFEQTEMTPADLDRIVVTEGPGSYTGVRIGVTTAKTMAWSLGIPLCAVSSMELLAQNGRFFNGSVVPFYDARRTQIYTGVFCDKDGILVRKASDQMILLDEQLEELKMADGSILFLSPDRVHHEKRIKEVLGDKACFSTPLDDLPRPGELALLGSEKEPLEDVHAFTPNYIRLAEAEVKWREANKQRKAYQGE